MRFEIISNTAQRAEEKYRSISQEITYQGTTNEISEIIDLND
jgi:hypothetical protein